MGGVVRLDTLASLGHVLTVDDSGDYQVVTTGLLADEQRELQRLSLFGLHGVPPEGCAVLAVFPGGDRTHGYVVADTLADARPRNWQTGEAGLYSLFNSLIRLKADGTLHILAPNGVVFDCPSGGVTFNVGATDTVAATGQVADLNGTMQEMRTTYNGHNHGGAGPTPLMS
jgi:phage gp45-like